MYSLVNKYPASFRFINLTLFDNENDNFILKVNNYEKLLSLKKIDLEEF